jgi:asparagine synthase (glutamine-hydrolysing)
VCGFIGAIGHNLDLERGLPWLARRGPDSQKIWASADGMVGLLHCRLAIVDTDPRASQPFHDSERGCVVALNGEIYNYRSLRAELSNYRFRTESDTEVITALYAAEGLKGFRRLEGMFSFALVDERARRVFLVRDAIGKKPLFTMRSPNGLAFGSSVLPLVAALAPDAEIDGDTAAFYWRKAFISPDRSAIKGSKPILPGEILVLDWTGAELARARCEPEAGSRYKGEDAQAVAKNIHALIARAVDLRLENNRQPAALLSGGIDSTVVAQVASTRLKERGTAAPLKLLTLAAFVPNTQDEYYARYAAKRLGLDIQLVRPGHRRLSDGIARALAVQDEPLGMPSYFLLHQMVEAASQHGRVLLTGDGGDEVFLGYRPVEDWRSQAIEAGDEPPFVKVGPGPSAWMGTWARDVSGSTLLGHMFAKADRASAEQGVEMRCPLLDWHLFSYVRSLPYHLVAGNGGLKPLLKAQLRSWPDWFLNRPKLGFAYNLRWRWALTRFDGLRESISRETLETFRGLLPDELAGPSALWSTRAIFSKFGAAWKVLAWSMFLRRLAEARSSGTPNRLVNSPTASATL